MTIKYIEKQIEDSQTGAIAAYHEITSVNTDYINSSMQVTLASYVSLKARNAGKNALSFNTATFNTLPDRDVSPHDWALTELIKSQPEDYTPPTYGMNIYAFADGEIKENTDK